MISQVTDRQLAPQLAQLGVTSFTEKFGHLYKPEDLNSFLKDNHTPEHYEKLIVHPGTSVWVAQSASAELIGYSVCGPCSSPIPVDAKNPGELKRLYLLPDYTRSGIGSKLMEPSMQWLEERYNDIFVSVYSENEQAIRFYERFGFKKIIRYYFMVGRQPDLEYIMKKSSP